MDKEKIKHALKKVRDFILCCRKRLDDVEGVINGKYIIYNI